MARRWKFALAGLAALAACSDTTVKDRFAGVVVYDDFPASARGSDRSDDLGYPAAFVLSAGFANGQAYQYLDLGSFNPVVPKMYVLMRDGAPVEGQYPIIDTLPDKDDYSPWWQIVEVAAPADYVVNDIKSKKALDEAGYAQTDTTKAVHCPVVNPDAAWISADLAEEYLVFWGTGESIPNPYFDPSAAISETNPAVLTDADATDADILLTPVWHKRLRAFCWSEDFTKRTTLAIDPDDGTASLDPDSFPGRYDPYGLEFEVGGEPGPVPLDLFPVFDAAPGDAGYSSALIEYAAILGGPDQPGAADELDPDGLIPLDYVDNPIVFPLYLERFEVTVENTTPDDGTGVSIGTGLATVSDGGGVLFEEDALASTALATLALDADPAGLFAGYPVTDRFFDTILASRALPALEPGESATVIVIGHYYFPFLSTAQAVWDYDDAFTGVSALPLYDDDFNPIGTQTEDLLVYASNYLEEDGVVAAHPDQADAIGTLTATLLGGAQ
ncbi:MAG: hypothetical protein CVU56_06965 [Deltaproteobacteria bacterium HGW-Deltaproteobacteria-14]|jgi:hypothetical protein|nr:MAG: hypothetical protein CVU56_06965 [Deltaproteobacteria bacterium HGW-Deltaproteobacteria-14]